MSTESIGFDVENPALNEYIRQRVQQEMEQYTLNKELDFLASPNDAQTSPGSMKDSMSDKFIAKLMEKLKNTEAYKESIYEAIEEMCEDQKSTNNRSTDRMKQFFSGVKSKPNKGELEQDVFSMMMLSRSWISFVWFYGCFAVAVQITLGILVIMDQISSEFGEPNLGIPIKDTAPLRIAKALAIILSIFTQTDFLMSLKNILMFRERKIWKELLSDGNENPNDNSNIKNYYWWIYVLLPQVLKGAQGLLILTASFILIIQSENSVNLLKDYSALFVISEVDNLFFNVADMGYVGTILSENAEEVKAKKFNEENKEKRNKAWLTLALLFLFAIFFSAWIFVFVGQTDGKYIKQAYPLCPFTTTFNETQKFKDIIGDGTCQFPKGEGTNVVECGWDGGDCKLFNDRYPECAVNDFILLGNEKCDGFAYNTRACGYDNGDCVDTNTRNTEKYPNCTVENIGWIGDGVCNGGEFASDNCDNDGGDCANCAVNNFTLVGDGTCDGSEYNNEACGFDGGDCLNFNKEKLERYPDCSLTNIGWIEDGVCDEENNIDGCLDGNDCVPSMKLIGDKYDGVDKWLGGVVGHDGNIYGIPDDMNKILKIDPSANAINPTALVGDDLGLGGGKWWGGVVGSNGIIYGVPYNANSILSYNPTTEKTKLIAENHPLLESGWKFSGGVLAENGMIYFIPSDYNKVIKFDPSNLEDPLTEIGDDLGSGEDKMHGGVLGSDGNIYGIPYNENKVLKIDVADDSTSFIGDDYTGDEKWFNGILAQDGNIYACPFHANQVLQINIQSQTINLVGPDLGDAGWKWSGFVEGEDGFLYGMPSDSKELLRFDPIKHISTLIPLPAQDEIYDGRWLGKVRAENGFIYGIPWRSEQQVLSIAPLKYRP